MKELKDILESRLGNVLRNTGHNLSLKSMAEVGDVVVTDIGDKYIIVDDDMLKEISEERFRSTLDDEPRFIHDKCYVADGDYSFNIVNWDDKSNKFISPRKITTLLKTKYNHNKRFIAADLKKQLNYIRTNSVEYYPVPVIKVLIRVLDNYIQERIEA